MDAKKDDITYGFCQIDDVAAFYRKKFATSSNYDYTSVHGFRYNIIYLKQNFVVEIIRPNSRVLDFGCGSGSLNVLKKIGCELTGVDYSEDALYYARHVNNYDTVIHKDIFSNAFNKYTQYFDYVVSLDVFGHIEFRDKNRTIERLKRLLKPGGVMIHGIEAGNIDYLGMSDEERKAFVMVDGHVGMESVPDVRKRFERYFKHVTVSNLFVFNADLQEVIKQHELYKRGQDEDLIDYLKSFSDDKHFAEGFNIGQYLSQQSIINSGIDVSGHDGFCFVTASDEIVKKYETRLPKPEIEFSCDFYARENCGGRFFRWSPPKSAVYVNRASEIRMKIASYFSHYTGKEQTIYIYVDDVFLKKIVLTPQKSEIEFVLSKTSSNKKIDFFSDSVFSPQWYGEKDHRLLSFMLTIVDVKP